MIATHDGPFHTDDVACVSALQLICDYGVIRTRDPKKLEQANILVDVGGEYDPSNDLFDHHQKGGAGARENGVSYASFGLVWKKYGSYICKEVLGEEYKIDFDQVAKLVDETLVQGIDARDNGVKTHIGINNANVYSISDIISAFNPNWFAIPSFDGPFFQAVEFFKVILVNEIRSQAGKVLAENEVLDILKSQPESKVLIFPKYVPWANLVPIHAKQALYVVFPDPTGSWRVQAVPVGIGKESFDLKAPLPDNWRGKTQKELSVLTNCQEVIFCHNAGFIMGAKTYESALYCANLAVQLHDAQMSMK